jgi:hypothetical protein
MKVVPRANIVSVESVNSDYCNHGKGNKNCYLCYSVSFSDNCSYSRLIDECEDCFDCFGMVGCRSCYQSINLINCYECLMCINCEDCSYCINCYDLTGKQYYIDNIQHTKEEFMQKVAQTPLDVTTFTKHDPATSIVNNEGCRESQLIKNSKNCIHCFDVNTGQDLLYCDQVKLGVSDCVDCTLILQSSLQRD